MTDIPRPKDGAMSAPEAPEPHVVHVYHRGYILALALIGLVSLGAWLILGRVIAEHEGTGAIINIAGRQRMLSQRIALHCLAGRSEALQFDIDRMEKASALLLDLGPGSRARGLLSPEAQQGVPGLAHDVAMFLAAARAARPDIVSLAEDLLPKLDRFVKALEAGAIGAMHRLAWYETLLFLVTCGLLLLEAFVFYRPLTLRLSAALEDARARRQEAESRQALTARILDQMEGALVLVDKDGTIGAVASRPFSEMFPEARPGRRLAEVLGETFSDISTVRNGTLVDEGLRTLEVDVLPFADSEVGYLVRLRDTTTTHELEMARGRELDSIRAILDYDDSVIDEALRELGTLIDATKEAGPGARHELLKRLSRTAASLGFVELEEAALRALRHAEREDAVPVALARLEEVHEAFSSALARTSTGPARPAGSPLRAPSIQRGHP